MKKIIATAAMLMSINSYAQSTIKDTNYYNSLQWKTDRSMQVYMDCTYTLPSKPQRVKYVYRNTQYNVFPYRNLGPVYYPATYGLVYQIPFTTRRHCK